MTLKDAYDDVVDFAAEEGMVLTAIVVIGMLVMGGIIGSGLIAGLWYLFQHGQWLTLLIIASVMTVIWKVLRKIHHDANER